MKNPRPFGRCLATTLLLLSLTVVACETSEEEASLRRQKVAAATAMEPIPGARPAPKPKAAPPPAPAGPPPPLEVFVEVLVDVSTQSSTIMGFVKEIRNKAGGCSGKFERATAHLVEANAHSLESVERFVALQSRYTQEDQEKATRLALPRVTAAIQRLTRNGNSAPVVLGAFRRECPKQAAALQGPMRERQMILQMVLSRVKEAGIVLR